MTTGKGAPFAENKKRKLFGVACLLGRDLSTTDGQQAAVTARENEKRKEKEKGKIPETKK